MSEQIKLPRGRKRTTRVTGIGLLVACAVALQGIWAQAETTALEEQTTLRYAKNFTVRYTEAGKLVTVTNAWRNSGSESFSYLLTEQPKAHPEAFPQARRIRIPATRVIATSTTFIPHFVELDALETLVGISDTEYVNTPQARERIKSEKLRTTGRGASMNLEVILAEEPDLVMTSAIGEASQDRYPALVGVGIPVVLSAAYMESHPLARAEWIKFTALFLNREAQAEAFFSEIEARYESLATRARAQSNKPTVFYNVPWAGSWYTPGGQSYKAAYVRDAGGNYLWSDDSSTGSMALDVESVFIRAVEGDIWLDTSNHTSRQSLLAEDGRYRLLKAFRDQRVYNNSKRVNEAGGNDFWERGVLRPDEVLADYVKIFHPDLLPEHELIYYKRLP